MDNIVFYDVKSEPFEVYGLYNPKACGKFCRIPEEVANATSPTVSELYTNTAGGKNTFQDQF
jgi:hypothetical protein